MLTFTQIEDVVCNYLDIEKALIFTKSRKRDRVYARQICMLMMYKYTKSSLKSIGEHFGGKDHTTVIHSKRTIKDLCDSHQEDRDNVNDIIHLLEELNTTPVLVST